MKHVKLIVVLLLAIYSNQAVAQDFDLDASMQKGETIYSTYCASCHMFNGTGIVGVYPPLINDDNMMNDIPRLVRSVLVGFSESNNSGVSHQFTLTDQEVSDLLNYIRNSWGNEGEAILQEDIQPAVQHSEN